MLRLRVGHRQRCIAAAAIHGTKSVQAGDVTVTLTIRSWRLRGARRWHSRLCRCRCLREHAQCLSTCYRAARSGWYRAGSMEPVTDTGVVRRRGGEGWGLARTANGAAHWRTGGRDEVLEPTVGRQRRCGFCVTLIREASSLQVFVSCPNTPVNVVCPICHGRTKVALRQPPRDPIVLLEQRAGQRPGRLCAGEIKRINTKRAPERRSLSSCSRFRGELKALQSKRQFLKAHRSS